MAILGTPDDVRWYEDKLRMSWELPKEAPKWMRLPVIRHIRAANLALKVERHYVSWDAIGSIRTGYDSWVLYAIQRGWC